MNELKESQILQKLALNVLKIKADYNRKPNKRVKIDVGLKCNYRCIFCYYKNHLKEKFKSLDIIKHKILSLYNCGFHEFDLSGGECTIHPNFFDILQYIKSLDSSVSVISNGFKFSDINFCKKCQKYGLNEVLFSLHSIKDIHNYITQNKFSFDNCLKGILNCQSLGFKVRINCTLCDINYKYLKEYIALINYIKPFELNFILFNYNDDQKQTSSINLKDICNEIDNNIDNLDKDIIYRIRYVPYCYLKHNENVYNYYSHIFDLWDWNLIYSYSDYAKPFINDKDLIQKNIDYLKNTFDMYIKKKECLKCKYFYICDGLKKNEKELNVFPIKK